MNLIGAYRERDEWGHEMTEETPGMNTGLTTSVKRPRGPCRHSSRSCPELHSPGGGGKSLRMFWESHGRPTFWDRSSEVTCVARCDNGSITAVARLLKASRWASNAAALTCMLTRRRANTYVVTCVRYCAAWDDTVFECSKKREKRPLR